MCVTQYAHNTLKMRLKFGLYSALSLVASAAVVYHAFATRESFYGSVVYLGSSKSAIAVFGNLFLVTAMWLYKGLVKVGGALI